ncbi:hypothetical protein COT66_01085 [Candidatus Shapirobacteria bacterium CG09_land_8_20_14_0_10_49_15]|uniref:DUF1648 domain-containing protein n=2 Tax=Candidatus Shapironibacteriota TaxID=1752721 RepID=A0A2M8L6R3_9BACT|nr:MAG: hypothetical protein COT66_01085 [Candidatus Shapirobacteria bacterium CG09_land_8_20_14_0_10_49_15]PJE69912.1 MAG: hypothetical protein COU97_02610 [Candidatus Shapirobacteria bacterium CG10_big_fil_rev_8_21_14_0_10_48_15]
MKKVNIILILAQLGVMAATWRLLPPQLPLFYNRPWGEDQLTIPLGLLLLPGLSLLVLISNFFFLTLVPEANKLPAQILNSASAVFALICLLTLTKIILLVTL